MNKSCKLLLVSLAILPSTKILATQAHSKVADGLVCTYVDQALAGSQLVLSFSGTVRFISPNAETVELRDSTVTADIFRKTSTKVIYKIVMAGRTDVFQVSLHTGRGTQTLSYPDSPSKVFNLSCKR